jgi:hypothetical protein
MRHGQLPTVIVTELCWNEITNGTDPLNANTDGDGVNDGQEATDGTDPLNSAGEWRWVTDWTRKTDAMNPR